jgi:hypothetical protein
MIEQRVLQLFRREDPHVLTEGLSASSKRGDSVGIFRNAMVQVFRGGGIPSRALVPIADRVDADFSLCRIL